MPQRLLQMFYGKIREFSHQKTARKAIRLNVLHLSLGEIKKGDLLC